VIREPKKKGTKKLPSIAASLPDWQGQVSAALSFSMEPQIFSFPRYSYVCTQSLRAIQALRKDLFHNENLADTEEASSKRAI
jgi:hypothetical protein